jgi:TfoX/Sxy family transcriptional regulator of competence genes
MRPIVKTSRDETLVARVREALASTPAVKEKKMFGSIAFMVRGHLCVAARAARIMCRIDPARHEAAVKRKGCEAVVMRGREYRGYVHVAADAVKTKRALNDWLELALTFNRTLEPKR